MMPVKNIYVHNVKIKTGGVNMLNKTGIYNMSKEFLSDYTIKDRFIVLINDKEIIIKPCKSYNSLTPFETLKRIEIIIKQYAKGKTFTFNIEKHIFTINIVKKAYRHKHKSQLSILLFT